MAMFKVTKKIHPEDTMTSEERIQAVSRLQMPDRVPVVPAPYYFIANYVGISYADLYNPKIYPQAALKVFDEVGPWDAYYFFHPYYRELVSYYIPMKTLEPGFELPPDYVRQFKEEEIMQPEDYELIIELGEKTPKLAYDRLARKLLPRIFDQIPDSWRAYTFILTRFAAQLVHWIFEFGDWIDRGATLWYSTGPRMLPFDAFSLSRGLIPFVHDLYKYPEEIKKASLALVESYIAVIKMAVKLFGIRRAQITLHRSSNDFLSPEQFKQLSLPSVKAIVERLADEGIISILHLDGNWDLNLEALRVLPAGQCIIQFDGTSDIFKAKEVLGDRMCIYGDVHPAMMALDSPNEVDEYCHRLIEEVGKGGGFILGTGCELDANAKPENAKVMMESVVKYGYY
jgi:hypothetical protein